MTYPQSTTRRELRETVRWKGKDRPIIVAVSNGNLVAWIKGARTPHLPLTIGGCYLKALAADAGVAAPPAHSRGRK